MSSRKINYNLRPSKAIERKLILEVLKEVCTIQNSNNYQYIGFGAVYFYDFKLFHRELNITDMTSIELKGGTDLERCKFNKPFKCIKIKHGHSNHILPKLNWRKKSITWLDYDGNFDKKVLKDVETCSKKMKSNSFFIVTVRKNINYDNLDAFEEEFGDDAPSDLSLIHLQKANHYKTIRTIILNKIHSTLSTHYANSDNEEKIMFKQLFNYTYQDGAPMYTIGGIFLTEKELEDSDDYHFMSFPFVSSGEEAYSIDFPMVTNKEIHKLNRYLPNEKEKFIKSKGISFIPEKHKKNYYNVYKFFPAYIEINNL